MEQNRDLWRLDGIQVGAMNSNDATATPGSPQRLQFQDFGVRSVHERQCQDADSVVDGDSECPDDSLCMSFGYFRGRWCSSRGDTHEALRRRLGFVDHTREVVESGRDIAADVQMMSTY